MNHKSLKKTKQKSSLEEKLDQACKHAEDICSEQKIIREELCKEIEEEQSNATRQHPNLRETS